MQAATGVTVGIYDTAELLNRSAAMMEPRASPAQFKRSRLYSPAAASLWENKHAEVEVEMGIEEPRRQNDCYRHGNDAHAAREEAMGKIEEDSPFYGNISAAATPAESVGARSEGDTIESMRNRISYTDYRDTRNLPSNSTSSIFASETISNPHADQLILCMAVVVQMRIVEEEQAQAESELPSSIFDEKEQEDATGADCSEVPTIDGLYEFLTTIYYVARYSPECHIIALVYLSRIAAPSETRSGIRLNRRNWRALVLTALILAQKVWDDSSLKTSAFSAITPYSKEMLKKFELEMLSLLAFQATVKVSRYAQHYFELRSLYESTISLSSRQPFPMRPLSISRAKHLQSRSEMFSLHKKSKSDPARCRTLEDVTVVDRTRYVLS